MATRIRLEIDSETYGRLMREAVAEKRPADWQAEVILRRALGTWEERCIGYDHAPSKLAANHEAEHASA